MPRKREIIHFRLSEEEKEKIFEEAKARDMSVSELIRSLCEKAEENAKRKEK